MKTLVLCPIGLGNFIMATPALRLLSQEVGRENLGLLALKGGIAHLGRHSSYFGIVHAFDPDKEGPRAALRLLLQVREERYGAALLLFPSCDWRYPLFAWLAGIRRRLGFAYRGAVPLLHTRSLPVDPGAHDAAQNLRLVRCFLGT